MDLNIFAEELNKTLLENKDMKQKLKAIQETTFEIREKANKQEEFSDIHITLLGIASILEEIIKS